MTIKIRKIPKAGSLTGQEIKVKPHCGKVDDIKLMNGPEKIDFSFLTNLVIDNEVF